VSGGDRLEAELAHLSTRSQPVRTSSKQFKYKESIILYFIICEQDAHYDDKTK